MDDDLGNLDNLNHDDNLNHHDSLNHHGNFNHNNLNSPGHLDNHDINDDLDLDETEIPDPPDEEKKTCHDGKCEKYTDTQVISIIIVYVFFSILWIVIVIFFELYKKPTSIILILPLILFSIALCNVYCMTKESTKELFQTSFITIGILFSIPLLTLINKESDDNVNHITQIIVIAIVLILFSYLHICSAPGYEIVWVHCSNCLETMAITLFLYCLLTYFVSKL